MKLPTLKSCLLTESIVIDDKEKSVIQKMAWVQIKKNKKNSLQDKKALKVLVDEMKSEGPYDLDKLKTDPKLSSYTGLALDELLTDWILEDGLRQEFGKYLTPEDKAVLQKVENKWTNQSEDKIPGGKADKKNPGDFNQKALKKGIAVEMEHTKNRAIAMEISMDHLTEDPLYYDKLEKVHKE